MNVELRIWNLQLVGFADYQLSNFELLFNIQYCFASLREQPASQSIAKALSFIFFYLLLTTSNSFFRQAKLAKTMQKY